MSKLEDLLPELAGVFAAQESAMENVVSLLTTQVAQLIQSNELQNRRVVTLEITQQQLQDALLTMRKAYDTLTDQQRAAEADHSVALGTLTTSLGDVGRKLQQQQAEVEDKWLSVNARLEAAGAGPSESQVMGLVGQHLSAAEGKLTAHLEHRLLETSNRSFLQVQQVEEAMKTELEVLEKKFEYLSRVKMEIKDLNKKIDKQDQTLDDMRMGMELLAKSIGTDESDNEGDRDEDDDNKDRDDSKEPLRRSVDKTEVMNVMKRISLSSADIQAKIDENAAMLASAAAAVAAAAENEARVTTTRLVRSRSVSVVPPQQAAFSRSKTVNVAPQPSAKESFDVRHAITSRRERGHEGSVMPLVRQPDSTAPGEAELALTSRTSASIPKASGDAVNEPMQEEQMDLIPETTSSEVVETVVESPEGLVEAADATASEKSSRSVSPEEPSPEAEEQQIQDVAETEPTEVHTTEPETPEQAPEAEDEAAEEETDQVVEILPSTSRTRLSSREKPLQQQQPQHSGNLAAPVHAMQHMPTTPNLAMLYPTFNASTAMIRSRKATRVLKRQHSNVRKDSSFDSSRSSTETRTLIAKDEIKQLWRRMFMRFVQFKRLQILGGASPDKIFHKQNMSVGARVRRLEEITADLEEMVDVLEVNIQANSQSVADHQAHVNAQVAQLHEDKQLQDQMIIGVEEKLDLIELDLRHVRTSSRRESGQTVFSGAVSALTTQYQELAARFSDHVTAFQGVEIMVKKLSELELPALSMKFETMLHDFRHEVNHKSKELAKELTKAIDRVQTAQVAAEAGLVKRTNACVSRLYRDLLSLSRAHLVSLEMVRNAKARQLIAATDGGDGSKTKHSLFNVGLEMLQSIFEGFQNDYQALQAQHGKSTTSPILGALLKHATDFQDELEKLKEQSAKAKTSAISAFSTANEGDNGASLGSSSFTDCLVLVTTTQLKALESLLASNEPNGTAENGLRDDGDDDEAGNSDVACQIKDLVVQLRAVLALLFLHSELLDPHQRLQVVVATQDAIHKEICVHDFALAQFNTVGATVKMMNSRLDSFLEMSFSFAKDEDVKKSIQEMLSSSDLARDSLSQQLEHTHAEAQKRDEMLERELTQLVARVNKKLDKDELLWTQEVLERQLQSVAKSSLGEDDLLDIHRLLRNKLDKTYFNALLLKQRNRMTESGGGAGAGLGGVYGAASGGGAPGNAPLIGAKCISCNSELPPTKAMIKSIVKDQVQHEVAKTLARQQPPGAGVAGATTVAGGGGNAAPSFNASTHRSMEKYKKEFLAATLQQQQQKTSNRK